MTKIQWTDETWNPIAGCSLVSPGCTNCYAMRMAARLSRVGVPHYVGRTERSKAGPVWTGKLALAPHHVQIAPLRWERPRRVFVNSMGDLFHEHVLEWWIDSVFAVMALTPRHTYQILTKRPERMRSYVTRVVNGERSVADYVSAAVALTGDPYAFLRAEDVEWPLANVWLGVFAEDQTRADERIPILLDTPAAVRFVSAEPLLGPLDLRSYLIGEEGHGVDFARPVGSRVGACVRWRPPLDWVIVGGESGPGHRPFNPDWARAIRDQCRSYEVPFFMKQMGGRRPNDANIPADLMIREYSR